jgi:hypothetical protein
LENEPLTSSNEQLIALGTEFWRLLKVQERLVLQQPVEKRGRLQAQLRFAAGRLESILGEVGIKLGIYDGSDFSPGLPVMAVNGEDFSGVEALVIAETLEPAYLRDSVVISQARVMVAKKDLS